MCAGLAQTVECLCFQLAYTFAGHTNGLTNFLQGIDSTICQTITQAQNLSFARWQFIECLLKLFVQKMGR